MYKRISRHDPDGILQHEWLNSRGAIARFDRGAIEIRILDVQECPLVDQAIISVIVALLKAMVKEKWVRYKDQKHWSVEPLAEIFSNTVKHGEAAVIDHSGYLEMFSYQGSKCSAGELWQFLIEMILPAGSENNQIWRDPLNIILEEGTLSRRIMRAVGETAEKKRIQRVYRELCNCLQEGSMFLE
jgi:gamma-glutamyl:cysteine ligase YbdK (ATP-grasp superfamily)